MIMKRSPQKTFVCKKDFSITVYDPNRNEVGFEKGKTYKGYHFYKPKPNGGGFLGTGNNGYVIDSGKRKHYFAFREDNECDMHFASSDVIENTFYTVSELRKIKLNKLKEKALD